MAKRRTPLGALEAVHQQGSPGLVHREALTHVLRVVVRALLLSAPVAIEQAMPSFS